jgi:benzodiazapine receptor
MHATIGDMSEAVTWYASLIKPVWAPPSWVFGPVWSLLYVLIAISFVYVFIEFARRKLPASVALPFALNLVFNFAFSPIQFVLQNNLLAAADIIAVLCTLVWALAVIWPYHRSVVYANMPYLLWTGFATVLQLTVTYLNF